MRVEHWMDLSRVSEYENVREYEVWKDEVEKSTGDEPAKEKESRFPSNQQISQCQHSPITHHTHHTPTHTPPNTPRPCHQTPLECLRDLLKNCTGSGSSMALPSSKWCPLLLFVTPPEQTAAAATVNRHECCLKVSFTRWRGSVRTIPYLRSLHYNLPPHCLSFPPSPCTD